MAEKIKGCTQQKNTYILHSSENPLHILPLNLKQLTLKNYEDINSLNHQFFSMHILPTEQLRVVPENLKPCDKAVCEK